MPRNLKLQLTFDDGPLPDREALQPILEEVARRGVVAAFFVLGEEVAQKPDAARKISAARHVLGNHSWDHLEPNVSRYTDDQIVKQFRDTQDRVFSELAVTMRHWRAPRRDLGPNNRLSRLLSGPGKIFALSHCDWGADSDDSLGETTAPGMLAALNRDLARVAGNEARLLFHVKATTATALPAVLNALVGAGHSFVDFNQTQ